jgi:hypothetical protein
MPSLILLPVAIEGSVQLVIDAMHFHRIVREGILGARTSLDIMTADFKAMLIPELGSRRAPSIVEHFESIASLQTDFSADRCRGR